MPKTVSPNSRSTFSIHPLQPILLPCLIACFVTAFACDLAFLQTKDPFLSTAAFWLLSMGIVIAALSIIVSLINLLREPRLLTLSDAWWQFGGKIFAVLISLYNWYLRYTSGGAVVMSSALILSLVVVCIFLFTGWKEMELVYRRRFDGAELYD